MIPTPSHRHHVVQANRNIGLAKGVISPSDHRPVAPESNTVIFAPSHRHHVSQAIRHIGLPIIGGAPSDHPPVTLERNTVISAPRHRHDVAQADRHVGLAITVVSPSDHCPATLERQTVISAPRHRHHVAQAARHVGLAIIGGAPSHDPFAYSKYQVRSVRHPNNVACCQPKMVNLIITQTGDLVRNPNNSCPTCVGEHIVSHVISRVCPPLEPRGCGQIISWAHHSSQHSACSGDKRGWQTHNGWAGANNFDGYCSRSRVDQPVICNEMEGCVISAIGGRNKNHATRWIGYLSIICNDADSSTISTVLVESADTWYRYIPNFMREHIGVGICP